ncbi:MAG TPA: GNAT family N-acetyltransferase [Nocardioidaceae bacterium]
MDVHRRLHGGTELTVSVATPAHAPAIVVLYASLSEQSQRRRFAGGMSFDAFAAAAALDPETGAVAVVASEGARVVGEARYLPTSDGTHELVVTVADDHQGQGLGGHLVDRLREEAARRGVRTLRAVVRVDDEATVRLLRRRGAVLVGPAGDREAVVELPCVAPWRIAPGQEDRAWRARTVGEVSTWFGSGYVPSSRSAVPGVATPNQ